VKTCSQCQVKYPDVLEFCPRDGSPLPPAPGGSPAAYDPLLGTTIDGRYAIEARLGEGGMGVVYKARHVLIDKPVAIKILRKEAAQDATAVQRFIQEAKSASKIGHSNIVDITDFGVLSDGHAYFVMEFLQGPTLAQALQEGPLQPARVCHIGAQMARGLHAAHQKGIVHRDLKPENIFLLEREGQKDFVKVVDFGIAKIGSGQRLTQVGMVLGTPEYMSPEQATGQETDHRVDQYALGCMMYEMLTGVVPFLSDRPAQTLTKHVFEPVIPPRQRKPELDIPPALEAVVLRTLAKKPADRFPSMRELEQALVQVADEVRSGRVVVDEARLYPSGQMRRPEVSEAALAIPTQSYPTAPAPLPYPSQPALPLAPPPILPSQISASLQSPSLVYQSAQSTPVYAPVPSGALPPGTYPAPEPRPVRETVPTLKARKLRSLVAVLIGGLTALVALLFYYLVFVQPAGRGKGDPPKAAAGSPTGPVPAPPQAAPPPLTRIRESMGGTPSPPVQPPPAPERVEIMIRSVPKGANVYIDGELLGTAPTVVSRPRGAAFIVEVRKSGHQPFVREVVADNNQDLTIALAKKGRKRIKGDKAEAPPPPPPSARDGLRNPFGGR
jgi:serine/threonine-protein kinase